MTAKMQGPANHGGISHEGTSYEPDENGRIAVPEHVVPHAFDHGFTLVEEPGEGEPAADDPGDDKPAKKGGKKAA